MNDGIDTVNKFIDNCCKGIEGLKDKHLQLIVEFEQKNEKIEPVLKAWTNSIKNLIEEKFEENFCEKFDQEVFEAKTKQWLIYYKHNQDFNLNIKLFFKSLSNLKSTIRSKIISSDPLCYNNLTDSLIQKSKKK